MSARRRVRQKAKGAIDPALGARLRALRLAQGKTQADLAGDDFSTGFISLIETGHTRVSMRAAEILANRLAVPLAVLFQDGERMTGIEDVLERALRQARELELSAKQSQREVQTALRWVARYRDRIESFDLPARPKGVRP